MDIACFPYGRLPSLDVDKTLRWEWPTLLKLNLLIKRQLTEIATCILMLCTQGNEDFYPNVNEIRPLAPVYLA